MFTSPAAIATSDVTASPVMKKPAPPQEAGCSPASIGLPRRQRGAVRAPAEVQRSRVHSTERA
eukprot:4763284-Prymnesium_polylepis.1